MRDRGLLEQRTSEPEHTLRGRDLASRSWQVIERAEAHMETSAQRLDRSQALLAAGEQRIRWVTRRVDGYRAGDDRDR